MEKTRKTRTEKKPKTPADNNRKTGSTKASVQAPESKPVSRPILQPPPKSDTAPGAIISRRAADRLRQGYLWVYASDIESVSYTSEEAPALVAVADQRGLLLGTALYSSASQIALRMVSREAIDETAWLGLLTTRLRRAIARRKPRLTADTDACRLCFSEADELPGLVVDRYGPLVIVQRLARGLFSAGVSETVVSVLREELNSAEITVIVERPDPRIRELEGLPAPGIEPLWIANAKAGSKLQIQFHLNGLVFHYDAGAGQKTGAFLDQRANYAAARAWAERLGATGRALDVCCYQGGFALHLAEFASA